MTKTEKLIEKGIIVIESCKTEDQLNTAKNYIKLVNRELWKYRGTGIYSLIVNLQIELYIKAMQIINEKYIILNSN